MDRQTAARAQRVWLITGASRGLGRALLEVVLADGDLVAAGARELSAEPHAAANLLAVRLDVTDEATIAAAVAQTLACFGRIDVLVNNAGYGLHGALEELTPQEVEAEFQTNVFGVHRVLRAALPSMRQRRQGHVITVSSIAGVAAYAGSGSYCGTKFALEGMTEALAAELAPLGIRVSIVQPGFFRTDFLSPSSMRRARASLPDYAETTRRTTMLRQSLDGKQPGDPKKGARAIIELVNLEHPPLRLMLGKAALEVQEAKLAERRRELDAFRPLSLQTEIDE